MIIICNCKPNRYQLRGQSQVDRLAPQVLHVEKARLLATPRVSALRWRSTESPNSRFPSRLREHPDAGVFLKYPGFDVVRCHHRELVAIFRLERHNNPFLLARKAERTCPFTFAWHDTVLSSHRKHRPDSTAGLRPLVCCTRCAYRSDCRYLLGCTGTDSCLNTPQSIVQSRSDGSRRR